MTLRRWAELVFAMYGHKEAMQLIADLGADVNKVNTFEYTGG